MIARLALSTLAALWIGCSFGPHAPEIPSCNSDSECPGNKVCFPDGCGEPDKNIVVEITANAVNGHLAQDHALEKVEPVHDFSLPQPAVIQGVVQIQSPGGSGATGYTSEVSFHVFGESIVIPGRTRSLSYRVTPDRGAFQFPVPTGRYALTALPTTDGLYPPWFEPEFEVQPGGAAELEITFSSVDNLIRFDGQLVQTRTPLSQIQSAAMEIQAFDPATNRAMSQRVPVSSGHAGATGEFFLYMNPPEGTQWFQLRATPKDSKALLPSKTFPPLPLDAILTEPLELGDIGTPVTVTGRALSTDGQPLERALVFIEGDVGGGGRFRSESVETSATGAFSLKTLPSVTGAKLDLWVAPRAKGASGLLRQPTTIPEQDGDLGDFTAPDKLTVVGALNRPEDKPATGVTVTATPIQALKGLPLPTGSSETATDDVGRFTLQLDPATYRLDFLPSDNQPRVSRLVTVRAELDGGGHPIQVIDLPPFTLSLGRTVTGRIAAIPRRLIASDAEPAPYASVKFFRVVTFDGKKSSILLAETTADVGGTYSVVLPTR